MLHYVLRFYQEAERITAATTSEGEEDVEDGGGYHNWRNPFPGKRAYIVLREELDYYVLPPQELHELYVKSLQRTSPQVADRLRVAATPRSRASRTASAVTELKKTCGEYLLRRNRVFDALRRGVNEEGRSADVRIPEGGEQSESGEAEEVPIVVRKTPENGAPSAEQQLIEMLCLAGFDLNATWGYRSREPGRCGLTSTSLVRLVHGDGTNLAQSNAAQKLMLFWRKPARKCWWDGVVVRLRLFEEEMRVRLWSRRTWTLELVLI